MAVLVLVWVVATCAVLIVPRRIDARPTQSGVCVGCGYSLAGLDAPERCPECGREGPSVRLLPARMEFRLRADRIPTLAPPLLLFIAMLAFHYELEALEYRRLGYSWDVARNAARIRRDHSGDLASPSLLLLFSPMIALLPSRAWRWRIIAIGFVLTLAEVGWPLRSDLAGAIRSLL